MKKMFCYPKNLIKKAFKGVALTLAFVCLFGCLFGCLSGCEPVIVINSSTDEASLYKKAKALMEKEEYKEAADIFSELGTYSLSSRYYWECMEKYNVLQYEKADELSDAGKLQEAYDIYATLDYEDSTEIATIILKEHPEYLSVGNYFYFGTFEQDDNEDNGTEPIAWKVLEIKNGKALIISQKILYTQNYTNETYTVTWENSLVRDTLNFDFYNTAFSDEERAKIQVTTVTQHENSEGSVIDPGDKTYDFIFLLSEQEAREYFSTNVARVAKATDYAKNHGCFTDVNKNAWWRLRTPGTDECRYVDVNSDGTIFNMGLVGNTGSSGIRPAMWIEI